jgi:hypothetical protein
MTTDCPDGITCVFVDVELGDGDCGLSIVGAELTDTFPDNQDYLIDAEDTVATIYNFGGCTTDADVGVGEWVLVGTVDVVTSVVACEADMILSQSAIDNSSLWGSGYADAYHYMGESSMTMTTICPGWLYDHVADAGHIDQADLAMFASCYMSSDPACAEYDYDMDGTVTPGDLGFWATGYDEDVCSGTIVIPCVQTHCDCRAGTGLMIDNNGTVVEVEMDWASSDMIQSFGLEVPDKSWEGWRLQPAQQDVRSRKAKARTR